MIEIVVHVFLMIVLVRMLTVHDRPWVYAGIYAAVWLGLRLLLSRGELAPVSIAFGSAAVVLAASALFFNLLSRLDNAVVWWGVALAGNVVVFATGMLAAVGVSSMFG